MNSGNLKAFTSEEARKQGARGGVASGEARRRKRRMINTLQKLLESPISPKAAAEYEDLGIRGEVSLDEAILLSMAKEAIEGNVAAARLILEAEGGAFAGLGKERRARIAKVKAEASTAATKAAKSAREEKEDSLFSLQV